MKGGMALNINGRYAGHFQPPLGPARDTRPKIANPGGRLSRFVHITWIKSNGKLFTAMLDSQFNVEGKEIKIFGKTRSVMLFAPLAITRKTKEI